MHKRDPCLIIPNNKGEKGTLRLLNVANIAKQFAKIDKCITIIFFDACREELDVPAHQHLFENAIQDHNLYKYTPEKEQVTTYYKGYSAIVYSCKEWQKSVETFNETNKYEEQEKGHTLGAKYLFDAFSQNCSTFYGFK